MGLGHYEVELKKDTPDSPLATRAAEHVQQKVPQAQQVVGVPFRAVVYPKTLRERLADGLERFETRSQKNSGSPSNSAKNENNP